MFQAECPICQQKVTASPVIGGDNLMNALRNDQDVRLVHPAANGDHQWSLDATDKKNLLKHIEQGFVKL
jgi:hypothetical protein